MEYTTLKNGIRMPVEGFGVFQVPDKEECKASVLTAIRAGYRLIDTAASYTNEDAVGENRTGISGSLFAASSDERLLQCMESYGRCV